MTNLEQFILTMNNYQSARPEFEDNDFSGKRVKHMHYTFRDHPDVKATYITDDADRHVEMIVYYIEDDIVGSQQFKRIADEVSHVEWHWVKDEDDTKRNRPQPPVPTEAWQKSVERRLDIIEECFKAIPAKYEGNDREQTMKNLGSVTGHWFGVGRAMRGEDK